MRAKTFLIQTTSGIRRHRTLESRVVRTKRTCPTVRRGSVVITMCRCRYRTVKPWTDRHERVLIANRITVEIRFVRSTSARDPVTINTPPNTRGQTFVLRDVIVLVTCTDPGRFSSTPLRVICVWRLLSLLVCQTEWVSESSVLGCPLSLHTVSVWPAPTIIFE